MTVSLNNMATFRRISKQTSSRLKQNSVIGMSAGLQANIHSQIIRRRKYSRLRTQSQRRRQAYCFFSLSGLRIRMYNKDTKRCAATESRIHSRYCRAPANFGGDSVCIRDLLLLRNHPSSEAGKKF